MRLFYKLKDKIAERFNKPEYMSNEKMVKYPFKTKLFIFCMLVLPLLQFIIFTVYINIDGLLMTFQNVDYTNNVVKFVGLKNYIKFFSQFTAKNNDLFIKTITNSFGYVPIVFLIMVPLQILSAYFLYKKTPASKFIIVMIFLPNLISPAVLTMAFSEMLSIKDGPLNMLLMKLFHYTEETVPIWLADDKYTMNILYIYTVWVGIGYNAVLMWGAMTRVPTEIIEASHLDGIGFIGEFFHITLPIMWPTLSMILITSVSVPFTVYMHSLLFTGGLYKTGTLALSAVMLLRNGDAYQSATVSVILSLVAVPIMLLARKILNKIYDDVEV